MKATRIAVVNITILVAPKSSLRLVQETLVSSILTSLKKTGIFANILTIFIFFWQERQESNLQFRFWRPVVCH